MLELETRSREHIGEIRERLAQDGYALELEDGMTRA
jgi:hypothetical protein